ncbi:MAG: PD-(D/E)XK nuclease family protein, partial [Planctomycetota bacterium]
VQILDWKTGAPREADRFQLEVYAFYARERWQVDPLQSRAIDAYLGDGSLVEVQVTETVLEATLQRIETSLDEMKAVHFNADESKGDPSDFPMVPEEESARACSSCGYRELCGRA